MKSFIKKILLFIFIFLVIEIIVNMLIPLPYYWGNPWIRTKIEFLQTQRSDQLPTVCFFGSSRIHRQIDPAKFDSVLTTLKHSGIKSFNLGAPATFTPQTYFLYENFLQSNEANNLKYAFMELMNLELINESLMHQSRTIYWQNVDDLEFVLQAAYFNRSFSLTKKLGFTLRYSVSWLENIFNVGTYGQFIVNEDETDPSFLGLNKNGFFPLESELMITKDLMIKADLISRESSLKNNPNALFEEKNRSIESFLEPSPFVDYIHLNRINQMIEMSAEKGVKLIFVVSPRNSSQALISLFNNIADSNKLEFSDPLEYPDLYLLSNTFDIDHLNTKGSVIYSTYLANKFHKKILNSN